MSEEISSAQKLIADLEGGEDFIEDALLSLNGVGPDTDRHRIIALLDITKRLVESERYKNPEQ